MSNSLRLRSRKTLRYIKDEVLVLLGKKVVVLNTRKLQWLQSPPLLFLLEISHRKVSIEV